MSGPERGTFSVRKARWYLLQAGRIGMDSNLRIKATWGMP